mgnify:CR=1 FL=1
MPLILPGNVASATADTQACSCRFDDGSSTQMNKTISSTSTTWTFSCWIKLNPTGTNQYLASWDMGSGESLGIGIEASTNQLFIYTTSTAAAPKLYDGKLRDPSAWMNIVIKNSSGTITSYINGTQAETSITGTALASGTLRIGCYTGSNYFYDGYMAEVVLIDGTAYSADSFGEFDSDSPTIWKPKDVSGLTFGSDGFYLDFENSSNLGNDANGGTDFTESNLAATDQTTDTPTNNFCTMNPLTQSEPANSPTFAEGNCKITMANFDTESVMATMGVTSGKWYWEIKGGWKTSNWGFGIEKASNSNVGFNVGYTATSYSFSQDGWKQFNSSGSQIDSGLSDGDIIGFALDLDNGHFNFSQNGVWYNGSASESTTFDASNHDYTSLDFGSEFVMPTISAFGDTSITTEINFGNPPYANSSDAADENGYGAFEYAPPSGYYALCTKNLAEFG